VPWANNLQAETKRRTRKVPAARGRSAGETGRAQIRGRRCRAMIYDCLIVGAGPAGLTAATYLGRYRRSVALFDAGPSRAALIPETHNHPAFSGISGEALLARLRSQTEKYGARIYPDAIVGLEKGDGCFKARTSSEDFRARRVLLCSGIRDVPPEVPGLDPAVRHSVVRYCPICDGYEATDLRIAVYGPPHQALKKALFLRTYSRDVTVVPDAEEAGGEDLKQLTAASVTVARSPAAEFAPSRNSIKVGLRNGTQLDFDVLYPALGAEVRSQLAQKLGAKCDDKGQLIVGAKQETSIPGIYAAGDVVSDLHQLCVAEGHAAVAATAIHNSLPPAYR
jgi:thioredoxin reductase (NADPH)